MAFKASSVAVLALFLAFFCSASYAVNITNILAQSGQFSTMSDLLVQTGIAKELQNRSTVTVLALDDKAIAPIAKLSKDVQKSVMMLHVILDYYGQKKLRAKPSVNMVSLYQSTGEGNGYLNATVFAGKRVLFKSQVKGSHWNAELLGEVAVRPYSLSVQQISSPIGNPDVGFAGDEIPQPAPAPKMPPKAKPPVDEAEAPESDEGLVNSPAPAPAPGLVADAPADSPATPASDEEADAASASSRIFAGVAILSMGLVSSLMVA